MKVKLLMAMTLDGKIAKTSDEKINWTGGNDKQFFKRITTNSGVVIMGSKTFDTIGKPLPNRLNIVMTRTPRKTPHDESLMFVNETPKEILEYLETMGFESCCLIGGSQINSLFIKENLIDELLITIVPKLFGKGLSLFDNLDLDIDLNCSSYLSIGNGSFLMTYSVIK